MQKELFIVSLKIGDTMDHAWSSYASTSVYESASHRDLLCSPTAPISFGIPLTLCKWLPMAEIWSPF